MLAVEVALLTGRYVATSFDNRSRAEWPPHPARFFSALAATHYEDPKPDPNERAVLLLLEELGPPVITASEASRRDVVTVFVPTNDGGIVSSIDDESDAVEAAAHELRAAPNEKARAAASRKLDKLRAKLDEATRRVIAPMSAGKESKEALSRAEAQLPERRGRQPRTFPSATPKTPTFVLAWPKASLTPEQRTSVDRLLARVVRMGHSSSLVSMRLLDGAPNTPTWVPDETGEIRGANDECILRVAEPGQLSALESVFRLQADEPGRVMPAVFQRYLRWSPRAEHRTTTTVFGQDWIVLRRVEGPRLPSTRTVDVARAIRSALLKSYGDGAPEILSGHRTTSARSERPHLAIFALPFLGHHRADGSILGAALVLPVDSSEEDRNSVYQAVNRWIDSNKSDEDDPRLPIHLGRTGSLVVEVVDEEAAQSTLQPRTWCRRATLWDSATPVALDRNPGDLRSSDPQKEAAAYAEAEATLSTACIHIGLPRPKRVIVMPASPLAGGDKARQFPPYSTGHPPIQRVLVHARLEFDEPVEGPIALGAGRYLGLGLFRPRAEHGNES